MNSHRAFLGATIANAVRGVLVDAVDPGGPADRAGIRPGDLIVALAGHPAAGTAALPAALATDAPGQRIAMTIAHPDGSREDLEATLDEYPGG